jgi:peroxiredoxin Q/BCP
MTKASRTVSRMLAIAALLVPFEGAAAGLAVGDAAPAFTMKGSDGKTYKLANLLDDGGSKGIVLSWFPMAFTSG